MKHTSSTVQPCCHAVYASMLLNRSRVPRCKAQGALWAAVSNCCHSFQCHCFSPCAKGAALRTSYYSAHVCCLGQNRSCPGTLGNLPREEKQSHKMQVNRHVHLLYCSVECGGGNPTTPACLSTDPQPVSRLLTVSGLVLKQPLRFLRELPNKSMFSSILFLNLSTTWLKHFPFCYYCIV